MSKIIAFFKDVRVELSKVQWPTRQELTRYTLVVIVMSLGVSIFLGAWDFLFEYLLRVLVIN